MSTESLNWIVQSMKANFCFDAIQILWFCPNNQNYYEIYREGYNHACATSLNYDFPMLYPQGFTQLTSPIELLPPSISESVTVMLPAFKLTDIYSKYLNKYGYQDGLSLELNSSGQYWGLIHFSSFQANHFNTQMRFLIKNFKTVIESWMQKIIHYQHSIHDYIFFYSAQNKQHVFDLIKGNSKKLKQDHILNLLESLTHSTQQGFFNQDHCYQLSSLPFPNGNQLLQISASERPYKLSKKEYLVLSHLVLGRTDREIAALLFLGERTIHSHVAAIIRKFQVSNRVEAVVYAIHHQLVAVQVNPAPQVQATSAAYININTKLST